MVERWGCDPVATSAFLKRSLASPTSSASDAAKCALPKKTSDALGAQPIGRVIFGDPRADAPHARHDRLEIHRQVVRRRRTEFLRSGHDRVDARRPDDRLGGDGAGIERIAAQPLSLDERHPQAEAHRPFRRRQSGRAAADDHQVVQLLGRGIRPVVGPHPLQQLAFVEVGRLGRPGRHDGHGYNHPPVKPARFRPTRIGGQRRMSSQTKPLR